MPPAAAAAASSPQRPAQPRPPTLLLLLAIVMSLSLLCQQAQAANTAPDTAAARWTGAAGSLQLADPGNWAHGRLPALGRLADLSAAPAASVFILDAPMQAEGVQLPPGDGHSVLRIVGGGVLHLEAAGGPAAGQTLNGVLELAHQEAVFRLSGGASAVRQLNATGGRIITDPDCASCRLTVTDKAEIRTDQGHGVTLDGNLRLQGQTLLQLDRPLELVGAARLQLSGGRTRWTSGRMDLASADSLLELGGNGSGGGVVVIPDFRLPGGSPWLTGVPGAQVLSAAGSAAAFVVHAEVNGASSLDRPDFRVSGLVLPAPEAAGFVQTEDHAVVEFLATHITGTGPWAWLRGRGSKLVLSGVQSDWASTGRFPVLLTDGAADRRPWPQVVVRGDSRLRWEGGCHGAAVAADCFVELWLADNSSVTWDHSGAAACRLGVIKILDEATLVSTGVSPMEAELNGPGARWTVGVPLDDHSKHSMVIRLVEGTLVAVAYWDLDLDSRLEIAPRTPDTVVSIVGDVRLGGAASLVWTNAQGTLSLSRLLELRDHAFVRLTGPEPVSPAQPTLPPEAGAPAELPRIRIDGGGFSNAVIQCGTAEAAGIPCLQLERVRLELQVAVVRPIPGASSIELTDAILVVISRTLDLGDHKLQLRLLGSSHLVLGDGGTLEAANATQLEADPSRRMTIRMEDHSTIYVPRIPANFRLVVAPADPSLGMAPEARVTIESESVASLELLEGARARTYYTSITDLVLGERSSLNGYKLRLLGQVRMAAGSRIQTDYFELELHPEATLVVSGSGSEADLPAQLRGPEVVLKPGSTVQVVNASVILSNQGFGPNGCFPTPVSMALEGSISVLGDSSLQIDAVDPVRTAASTELTLNPTGPQMTARVQSNHDLRFDGTLRFLGAGLATLEASVVLSDGASLVLDMEQRPPSPEIKCQAQITGLELLSGSSLQWVMRGSRPLPASCLRVLGRYVDRLGSDFRLVAAAADDPPAFPAAGAGHVSIQLLDLNPDARHVFERPERLTVCQDRGLPLALLYNMHGGDSARFVDLQQPPADGDPEDPLWKLAKARACEEEGRCFDWPDELGAGW